jgi:ABC-type transport system involved in multi-copper enzyme maturation permease subunit
MRFREIFRFEAGHRLRQPSTWFYLGLVFALALLRADAVDLGITQYHAPVNAAGSTLAVGIMATLVTAGLFVDAAQRDPRWRMEPLFYTTPLRGREYLGGRFAGSLLVNAILLLLVPIGLVLGAGMAGMKPEELGTVRLDAYVMPYLVFLLPNLLVNGAVLFGIALLTRRSLPGYLGALALTVAYMFAMIVGQRSGGTVWAMVDPTGAVAMQRQTGGWTRVELNSSMLRLEGLLLWNRLLWITVAAAMLALALRRFRLMHAAPAAHRRASRAEAEAAPSRGAIVRGPSVAVPRVPRAFGARTHGAQVMETARIGFRQVVGSRDFLLIAIGLFVFALISIADVWIFGGMLFWPLTRSMVTGLTSQGLPTIVAVLTVFYAGELVWREREAGIEKLGDSAPVPDWVPLAGKLIALAGMLVILNAVLMASGITGQAMQGWYAFQPALYLKMLFGVQLVEQLQFAVLALLAHVIVNQKYAAHLVAVLLYVGTLQARSLGIEHNLLVYGSDPGLSWSDLNGFGPFLAPFVRFKLYWASWALLLCIVALLAWVRGTEGGFGARVRQARRRFTPRVAAGAAAMVLLVMGTGAFVFYNTNVLNEYRTAWERDAVNAGYERRYKRFEHAPQPSLAAIGMHVELYPERNTATVRATYRLVNRTGVPIDSIHLSVVRDPQLTLRGIRFDRPARRLVEDDVHGYRIHRLEQALQPGDSLRMDFELAVAPRGFRNREVPSGNTVMVGEFTNLGSWILPSIGYQRGDELSSADARREHGLPPTGIRPSIHDPRARQIPRMGRIHLDATIGTSAGQTAVAPGRLLRSWTKDGRRYFQYQTEAPVLDFFSVLSSRYAVREGAWTDPRTGREVEIRVIHHPDHAVNVDRIIRIARTSLDYFTAQFGPYPHRQLALVEIPRYSSGARTYGGMIVYSESSPMAAARTEAGDREAVDDPALMLAAHELGHLWWGQQVMGADVQGSQMLSETLAQYSAAMVMKRTRGAAPAREMMEKMHETYLSGRGRNDAPEVPLLLTTDHAYLHYGKGAVAMYTLQEYVGEARINTALRRLVQAHGNAGPPYATTLDLYRELRAVTPDSLRYLLHDLLATITLWDLRATGARAEPAGGGAYRVTLDVEAAKLRSDSVGNDTEVPMSDLVQVGVLAESADGDVLGAPLYLAHHRLRSGQQTITITVQGRPARAGIDPYHQLIVRHREALQERDVKVARVEIAERSARWRAR